MLLYILDILGTAVFAISGVLLAGRLRMDGFGVLVLASVTAIGGGTIRDLILGIQPIFWVHDIHYIWTILITSLLSILIVNQYKIFRYSAIYLQIADAIGLSVFVAIGVDKALNYGTHPMIAIIMGVITACGGGVIRDIFARQIPMIFRKEIYATACIAGGIIHTSFLTIPFLVNYAFISGVTVTLLIRLAAIYWRLSLPIFKLNPHS